MLSNIKKIAVLVALCMLFSLTACTGATTVGTTATTAGTTAVATTAATTAAATTAGEAVELTIVHQYPREDMANSHDGTIWNDMTDKYVADHPDAKFNISGINQAELHIKIQAQAAADDLPDVFMLKGSWVSNFVKSELLLDFTPYLENCPWKDAYKPVTFKPFTRDGKLYGMPVQFASTSFVYYNADLWASIGYDKFPDNWDDVIAAAAMFNEKNIIPIAAGNKDKWFFESCWFSTLGDRFTGTEWTTNVIANNGKAKFTDPDFVSALSFLQNLIQKNLCNVDFNAITNAQSIALYSEGKAATTIDGYWAISAILNQGTPELIKATKMAIMPKVPNQKGEANAASGGGGWSIATSSRTTGAAKDMAADYCLYITGQDYSKRLAEDYGEIGACNVEAVDVTKFDQLIQDYVALVGSINFTPIYDIEMDGAVIEVMNSSMQEMLNGTKTPQQVAEEIQAEQDKLSK